ncbi:MAG: hypothetical protein DRN99_07885 [Thermoproteota archaeon]|nr:MAG: hypothetical protein DRN99_07885 [Candidatus Korarchaeota archaeon]
MAPKAGRELLVETDFLFGLREDDRLHEHVMRALKMHENGKVELILLSSAVIEFRAVLYSSGLKPEEVEEAAALALAILTGHEVNRYLQIQLEDLILAEKLRARHGIGFFDSLHASAAKRTGIKLLSSDEAYRKLDIPYLSLKSI